MNLRYPSTLGRFPFLASVAVTKGLISVTVQAAATEDATSNFTPVAAFSIAKEKIVPLRPYAMLPQYPGAGGWIVFGSGIGEANFTGRFNGPPASLLAPRAARAYQPLPVSSLGKLFQPALTGLVTLKAQPPLTLTYELREIEGRPRDAIVVRLAQPSASSDALAGGEANVFEQLAGPCGGRPESGNCGDPAPIELLNAVQPDCEGNITIEFRGCAIMSAVEQECGIVLDCDLGLGDVCQPDHLPAADGRLENEYDDACSEGAVEEESDSLNYNPAVATASETVAVVGTLPHAETFAGEVSLDWAVVNGHFEAFPDDLPYAEQPYPDNDGYTTEGGTGDISRNVTVWKGFDHLTVGRRYTTDLKILPGGSKHNGGIVLNYRPSPDFSGRHLYHLIELDYDEQVFRIRRYNGTQLVPEPNQVSLVNVQLDRWYRISVSVSAAGDGEVALAVSLEALEGPELALSFPLITSRYLPDVGRAGLHADKSLTRFGYLLIEEN